MPSEPGASPADDFAAEARQLLLDGLRLIALQEPARLFTVEHTAEYLDTSVSTIRRLLAIGELLTVRLSPQQVRVRADDLAAFIDRHTETELDNIDGDGDGG